MTFHLTEEYHLLPFDFCHEAEFLSTVAKEKSSYTREQRLKILISIDKYAYLSFENVHIFQKILHTKTIIFLASTLRKIHTGIR